MHRGLIPEEREVTHPSPYDSLPLQRDRRRPWRRSPGCGCGLMTGLIVFCLVGLVLLVGIVLPMGERLNILVLGLDRRPGEGDAVRADAIMVVTAKASEPVLGLFSIPRDLYLNIPGQGENRINTAHIFGEIEQPGSGPERTAGAIAENFGIPVHGWIRIDFDGFIALVDAVGGVEIDVPEAVIDYSYPTADYGTMLLEIPAGIQHMDGERALQYARSRHSGSDFDRAARQQLLVRSVVQALARPANWIRLPAVYRAFADAVDSKLSWSQLVRVGVAALRVGPEGIDRLVIDEEMVTPFMTPSGAAVLELRRELVQPLVQEMFDIE